MSYKLSSNNSHLVNRTHFLSCAFFCSAIINILSLTGPIFMILVIDKVLNTKSLAILISFSAIALIAYGLLSIIDYFRQNILFSYAKDYIAIDKSIAEIWMSKSANAAFDSPWIIIFFMALMILHPLLGLFSLSIITVHIYAIFKTHALAIKIDCIDKKINDLKNEHQQLMHASHLLSPYDKALEFGLNVLQQATDENTTTKHQLQQKLHSLSSHLQTLRMSAASAIIGLGAWLAISGSLSAGAIVASSILLQRCTTPLEIIRNSLSQLKTLKTWFKQTTEHKTIDHKLYEGVTLHSTPKSHEKKTYSLMIKKMLIAETNKKKVIFHVPQLQLPYSGVFLVTGSHGAGKSVFLKGISHVLPISFENFSIFDNQISNKTIDQNDTLIHYCPSEAVSLAITLFLTTEYPNAYKNNKENTLYIIKKLGMNTTELNTLQDNLSTNLSFIDTLSTTIRKKLMLCRALVKQTKITVIDDPEYGMSEQEIMALIEIIHFLANKKQQCFIIASNHKQFINSADIKIAIKNGKIEAVKKSSATNITTTTKLYGNDNSPTVIEKI